MYYEQDINEIIKQQKKRNKKKQKNKYHMNRIFQLSSC